MSRGALSPGRPGVCGARPQPGAWGLWAKELAQQPLLVGSGIGGAVARRLLQVLKTAVRRVLLQDPLCLSASVPPHGLRIILGMEEG